MIAWRNVELAEIQFTQESPGDGWVQLPGTPNGGTDGWRWDDAALSWQPVGPRLWQPVDFMATLFTPAEVVALDMLPAAPEGAPALRYAVALARLASSVNLDDPITVQLVGMAVAAGVLTEGRAARILAGLPPA